MPRRRLIPTTNTKETSGARPRVPILPSAQCACCLPCCPDRGLTSKFPSELPRGATLPRRPQARDVIRSELLTPQDGGHFEVWAAPDGARSTFSVTVHAVN